MTRQQKFLIGAFLALLGLAILIFRGELFIIPTRPGVTALLQNIIQPYGMSLFILLFAYFLARGLNVRYWLFVLLFVVWELSYIITLNFGPVFLSEKAKSKKWINHIRKVGLVNRSTIQFQNDSGQFDEELFYTLKPGSSKFKSYEFNTSYKINSLGVRDDEESLSFPKVLFLGDSFTMGWGVEQDETFAHLFEEKTGLKSLNSGICSYGTSREYRMMARTQTDSLKAVIIQFHDTDLEENAFYVKNNRLGARGEEEFNNQVELNKRIRTYHPFKYVKTVLTNTVSSLQDKARKKNQPAVVHTGVAPDYPDFLAEFYTILAKIREIKNVQVIITYTGGFHTKPQVIEEFEAYASTNGIENVHFVNLGDVLRPEDYFFFDDHINARGHQKVATALVEKFKSLQ